MNRFKKIFCLVFVFLFVLTQSNTGSAISGTDAKLVPTEMKVASTATIEDDFVDNHVLVVLTNEASLQFRSYSPDDFPEIDCLQAEDLTKSVAPMVQMKVDSMKGIQPAATASVRVSTQDPATYNQILCLELPSNSKANVLMAIKQLEGRDDILYAGPDFYVYGYATPSDYNADTQWGVGKISLPSAWNITTGSSSVTVGILDTGIDFDHPDLENQLDLNLSKNFVDGSSYSTITNHPGNHGTATAGIIGAQENHGTCITGVCWDVTLISLRVLKESILGKVTGESSDIIEAIQYAESVGIDILNYSGGTLGLTTDEATLMYQAVQNYSGLLVCAAGNKQSDNDEVPVYPANLPYSNVISVGASTNSDQIWANLNINDPNNLGSNYGDYSVDLFAPGEGINSTIVGDGYASNSGTSFAAPFVTGVAALMLSIHPQLTPAQIRAAIINSVDEVAAFEHLCLSGGRLNAYKALSSDLLHSYSTSDYTIEGHLCQGYTCEYVQRHTLGYHVPYNAVRHRRICSYCGYSAFSSHTYHEGNPVCYYCGYDSSGLE